MDCSSLITYFWNAMKSLYTEIVIDAPADAVWKILTDFQSYPDWNPFIRSFEGVPEPGRQFSVTIQPTGKKPMTFKPVCLALIPEEEFRWLGTWSLPDFLMVNTFLNLKDLTVPVRFLFNENIFGACLYRCCGDC